MLNPCKEREPKVIDNALIEKCIDLQYPKGEVGRLLRLERIPMEDIKQINFDYLYILKIDHLWVLKSLVKLSLNNNFIEKIEGLETLVLLKELDLSFNRISKIENMDTLVNLEKITFYENLIEVVENLDNQKKMTVFSIGKNKISDQTSVHYFRRFKALTSLNMAGNPCAEDPDFRLYVAAFLPTPVYYEYRRIRSSERKMGAKKFKEILTKLEREESAEKEKTDALEKELNDAQINSKMFVEYMNTAKLFDMMYEHDPEGNALLGLGEEASELHAEYKKQFLGYCQQIFEIGQKHFEIRQNEVDNFQKSVDKAKKDNQDESISHMESFIEKKDEIFGAIKRSKDLWEHDAISEADFIMKVEEFRTDIEVMIHSTWKQLMKLEVALFEQVDDVIQTFGHVVGEMINTLIEEAQGVFTNIRAAEVSYSETLNDIAIRFMATANINPEEYEEDIADMSEFLKDIITDRDTLNNAMSATHDIHMQTIDAREDLLVQRAKAWLNELTEKLVKEEFERNRYKILEINHFLDLQKAEFIELSTLRFEVTGSLGSDIF